MIRRRTVPPKPVPDHWVKEDGMKINGRLLSRGTEVSIRDHDGRKIRARFLEHVQAGPHEWITVSEIVRSTGEYVKVRSFTPDKVETVHTKRKERK